MASQLDQIFIYPTDTVWGIGCSIYSEMGHAKIAEIKKTSKNKPLSIMFSTIEELTKSFEFPSQITLSWLKEFFALETTLGFPLKASKIRIPKWVTGDSEFVSLRCLETDAVKNIYQQINSPFFTTSLNISGEPPITDSNEALQFQKLHAPAAQFIKRASKSGAQLSGAGSTIVFFSENLNYEIKREGKRIEEVKKHLQKLS